jgi:hypothetical protein
MISCILDSFTLLFLASIQYPPPRGLARSVFSKIYPFNWNHWKKDHRKTEELKEGKTHMQVRENMSK